MSRRSWVLTAVWLASWIGIGTELQADEQQANLNETLRSVLKCRRPQEFAYVDLVTAKVESGELPRALVLSMMKWAAQRSSQEVAAGRRKTDIPFPYFQEGLRRRAAEIGVSLPAFAP